ncbi:MAG: hypothetical protein QXS20_07405 [Candidatus Thorarchaeota archaeon]
MVGLDVALVSLIPPFLMVASGVVLERTISSRLGSTSIPQKILLWVSFGYTLFLLPYVLVGILTSALRAFVILHSFLVIIAMIVVRSKMLRMLRAVPLVLKSWFRSANTIVVWASVSYVMFGLKTFFMCLLGPIVSGDAMYLWLSMARVFFNMNQIPMYDPYHFLHYNAEPGSSALYSWGLFIVGSAEPETFRGIPIPFFLCIPLAVFHITREWGSNEKASYVALALASYLPSLDYLVYAYAFYVDAIASLISLTAIAAWRSAIVKKSNLWGFIAGLLLATATLSRYHLGILVLLIMFIQMLALLGNSRYARVFSVLTIVCIVTTLVLLGNGKWSFLSNPISVMSFILLTAVLIWFWNTESFDRFTCSRDLARLVLSLAAGGALSLIWGVRMLANKGALFGIELFRLYRPSEETTKITDLLNQAIGDVSSAHYFTLLTPIGFVFHFLANGYFVWLSFLMILVCAARRTGGGAIWCSVVWYIGYLSLLGYYPSGRHLIPSFLFLCSALAIGMVSLCSSLSSTRFRCSCTVLVVLFCLTSVPQMMTTALAVRALGLQDDPLYSLMVIPYTTNFGWNTTPNLVLHLASVGLVLASGGLLLAFLFGKLCQQKQPTSLVPYVILALVLSSSSLAPLIAHSIYITGGDLTRYDDLGSWNRSDHNLARYLKNITGPDDVILTYGDVVLSYRGFRVIDLFRGGLYAVPLLHNLTDPEEIHIRLWEYGIRFVVIPSPRSYLYPSYCRFVDVIPFPEVVVSSNEGWFLCEYSWWRIYALEPPSPPP